MNHAIARIVYETAILTGLPLHVWAVAMMFFHAYQEYSYEQEPDDEQGNRYDDPVNEAIVGITCLILSVKSNESYLNSKGLQSSPVQRLQSVLESAARVILSYTACAVSTESIVQTKRKLKEIAPTVELAILRIVGNSLLPDTAFLHNATDSEQESVLIEIYSSPICLNFPADDFLDFVNGRGKTQAIPQALAHFFA